MSSMRDVARTEVLATVAKLQYKPNAVARSLRTGRSKTLGLVIPDNSNLFLAELAWCLENENFGYGYNLREQRRRAWASVVPFRWEDNQQTVRSIGEPFGIMSTRYK